MGTAGESVMLVVLAAVAEKLPPQASPGETIFLGAWIAGVGVVGALLFNSKLIRRATGELFPRTGPQKIRLGIVLAIALAVLGIAVIVVGIVRAII